MTYFSRKALKILDFAHGGIIMGKAIEQSMIEARPTRVTPIQRRVSQGVKGKAAEEYVLSRGHVSGPSENIRRTVAYAESCQT